MWAVKTPTLLAESFSLEVKLSYASNPFSPPPILEMLSMDTSWIVRRRVASNPSAPQSTQLLLAKDPYPEVRSELALNPNLAPSIAKLLLGDAEPLVRIALAQNPRVEADLLLPLTRDPLPQVREALASREPLSPLLAQNLAQDASMTVLLRLLRNRTCPPQTAGEILLGRLKEEVAVEVVEMTKPLPIATQLLLAEQGGLLLRSHLARAPWIDESVWLRLKEDPDPFVREMAKQNIAYGTSASPANTSTPSDPGAKLPRGND
jgi:hypothetical protein